MSRGHATDAAYGEEFEAVWRELYRTKDRTCPVWQAIRNTAWRRRPNHIDLADFEAPLPGRMYQKLKANFRKARRAGMSNEEWRRKVGKLTTMADWAARDEVRVVIEGLRSKSNPEIWQLTHSDFATREDTDSEDDKSRPEPAQKSSAVDEIPTLTSALHDSRDFVLCCVRGECRSRDQLEHFRGCEDCQTTLKTVNDCLADFVVVASVRAINREHILLIDDLELRPGAIQFLIACRKIAEKRDYDILDRNLNALGYRVHLQQRARGHSKRKTPRSEQQLDDFAIALLRASTLLVFARRDRHETRFMKYGFLYIAPPTDTLSTTMAFGLLARAGGRKGDRGVTFCGELGRREFPDSNELWVASEPP